MTLDLYKVLEVHPRATGDEIKKAFRRVALGCHPDRNAQNREAEERFKDANFAYSVLGDPQRRRRYDLYRSFRMRSADLGFVVPPSRIYEKILEDFFMNAPLPWMGTRSPLDFPAMAGFRRLFSTSLHSLIFLKRLVRALQREGFFRSPWGTVSGMDPGPGTPPPGVRTPDRSLLFPHRRRRPPVSAAQGTPPRSMRAPLAPNVNGDREWVLALACEEAERGTVLTVSLPVGAAWERLRVRIPPGVRDGIRLRLRNKGARSREGGPDRGDLYLRLRVA